ncbi:hypothetical protein ISF_00984 [Cordyceps fumosorosea ARSEF 2679]|uniref:Ams2/SPT21 N-terminal domain-containing protein n=1 Tax=Cordyceps fumosorosea (strain ARSEF 2679) TaxID=1081104 RepID=A0A168EPZ6_CORFA|nr:hypothetical protein ISF_00984 [Cordyceps fumosorosea ARSEF 2679]OAA74083.1 hypothetical protein ISF_00984 [Cordyceps fumosorosea ARSEF 2679]
MASPLPASNMGAGWNGNASQQQFQQQQMRPAEPNSNGVQVRSMGLKVQYTFDKDSKINCLARCPHTVHVQTIALDEVNTIGVIDLGVCVRAVSDCSPELAGQDCDYTIYAVDYSEPDTPLVGQGLLSLALDSLNRGDNPGQQPKLVTGRVTQNLLGVFSGGNRETLEVKLRLSGSAKPQWQTDVFDMAMTPGGVAEWNSLVQSNPQLGQPQHVSRVASPALSHGPPAVMPRRDSFGPAMQNSMDDVQRVAPIPVDPNSVPDNQGGSSRPSSRASNRAPRKRKPTGRPRGRPRKNPIEGNTSGYEDCTEGEDGPAKKRAKPTQVDKPNPFAGGPDSLRVAASASASLRNFRPVATNSEGAAGSHLQEVPRAPTPVPNGSAFPGRALNIRRESTLGQKPMSYAASTDGDARNHFSPQDDGRSPDSIAPTPAFSEDSPPEIGSSPPVPHATPFLRSSPPPSSPVLPPMPPSKMPRDASFLSDNMELFGEESLPPPQPNVPAPKAASRARNGKAQTNNARSVPIQVYQMQDGPQGQDLVHICSYNTTYPNTSQQQHWQPKQQPPGQQTPPELPPLKQSAPRPSPVTVPINKDRVPSPPGMAPTPPPTTDAVEKPPTPVADLPEVPVEAREIRRIAPEPVAQPAAEDKQRPSSQPPASTTPVLKAKKPLARSNSAGPLMMPNLPASEPAGPSTLAQTSAAEEDIPHFQLANPRRVYAAGAMEMVPASDPPAPIVRPGKPTMPEATMPPSEPIQPPPSSPNNRSNKNIVKKHAIKQRLEEAIMNGTMPPFCSNCGAIETPTWRKIWVQDREGVPEYAEYSEKPGRITAIEITQRDENEKPTQHRVIKKGLGPTDDKANWQELLLCNPCGIWLTKCKTHRPADRWDKDASRLGQERRKRGTGRSKKSRAKSDSAPNPISEAYLLTDAMGPPEPSSPKHDMSSTATRGLPSVTQGNSFTTDGYIIDAQSIPGSTHSAASGDGTARSPIDLELDQAMGTTKRLLFPSPRKPGTPKVLSTVDVNVVLTDDMCNQNKGIFGEKENMPIVTHEGLLECDDPEALFRNPVIARPSTPTNAKASVSAEPFKTPTRATPSHRPVTRSVSKSLRTVRSVSSPSQLALLQATPTKTPRSIRGLTSLARRRSPRNHQNSFGVCETPISKSISQFFSEPAFALDSEMDLDISNMHDPLMEFGNFLSTDAIMPSSPPRNGSALDASASFDYEPWAHWNVDDPTQGENE